VLKHTLIILDQGEVGDDTLILENISYWRRLLDRWQQVENKV